MATTNVSIRMDTELKAQADELFAELGMNLSTAFNIFVAAEAFPTAYSGLLASPQGSGNGRTSDKSR